MNMQQRRKLRQMLEVIEYFEYELEVMASEELVKYDNMPEGLKECEQGQAIYEAADTLEDAASNLQDWVDELRENFEID